VRTVGPPHQPDAKPECWHAGVWVRCGKHGPPWATDYRYTLVRLVGCTEQMHAAVVCTMPAVLKGWRSSCDTPLGCLCWWQLQHACSRLLPVAWLLNKVFCRCALAHHCLWVDVHAAVHAGFCSMGVNTPAVAACPPLHTYGRLLVASCMLHVHTWLVASFVSIHTACCWEQSRRLMVCCSCCLHLEAPVYSVSCWHASGRQGVCCVD
jgi:hypothetical protein